MIEEVEVADIPVVDIAADRKTAGFDKVDGFAAGKHTADRTPAFDNCRIEDRV